MSANIVNDTAGTDRGENGFLDVDFVLSAPKAGFIGEMQPHPHALRYAGTHLNPGWGLRPDKADEALETSSQTGSAPQHSCHAKIAGCKISAICECVEVHRGDLFQGNTVACTRAVSPRPRPQSVA